MCTIPLIELAANYRCTPVTRKPYGHGENTQMLYHFTIEEIRDYGAVPIIKVSSLHHMGGTIALARSPFVH